MGIYAFFSSFSELIPLFAIMLATGLAAGFLAGVFGIGGGAILTPIFYQMFGALGVDETTRMHLCVGTSLAIIVPTSIRSLLSHLAYGNVDRDLLRSWVLAVPVGVIIASWTAAHIPGEGLRIIFAFIAAIVGIKLLFAKDSWRLGNELPGNPVKALVGGSIGFFSALMGIGGGIMNNIFMTLYGRPIHQAVSTSSGVGALISIPGAIGFALAGSLADSGNDGLPVFSIGFVNWMAVAVVTPITLLIAPLGARMTQKLSKRRLEMAFGIFMLIASGRFYYSLSG